LRANTPALRAMLGNGAFTFWAETTAIAITLPSHASMLTGVIPNKHNVLWNSDLPFSTPVFARVPTVMEMATKAGYTTALISGKSKLAALNKPGTVTHFYFSPDGPGLKDADVAAKAVEVIAAHKPNVIFIHFPDVDAIGHERGWGAPEQILQIEKTDALIAKVVAALDDAKISNSTAVILTADHGGAGQTHGADDARSRHIPWIITGPRVRSHYDLTRVAELKIRTEDTCATACWLLGLPQAVNFDGHPIEQAFESLR